MPINVSIESKECIQDPYQSLHREMNCLGITGLSVGANTIRHGLGKKPIRLSLRPGAAGKWGETQLPDDVNLYITVGSGAATTGRIDTEHVGDIGRFILDSLGQQRQTLT